MAFICEECMKNYEEVVDFGFRSWGACEDCKRARRCLDIPSFALTLKPKKREE